MLKMIKLEEALEGITPEDSGRVEIGLMPSGSATESVVVSYNDFANYLVYHGDWYFIKRYVGEEPEDSDALLDLWSVYKGQMACQWQRAFTAITTTYKPLDNYEGHTTITTTKGATSETIATGARSNSATTGAQEGTTTAKGAPFNSEVYNNNSETVSEAGARTDMQTIGAGIDTRTTNAVTDTTTEEKRGNMGVVSSQTMLSQELEIRRNNFCKSILSEFLSEYCVLY